MKVLVTRAADQAGGLVSGLRSSGAEVVEFPTIKTVPPASWDDLDRAIGVLSSFEYVIFTSVNALAYFMLRLEELGRGGDSLKGLKFIAVGPKTAEALAERGLKADLVPREFKGEGVAEALSGEDIKGKRFLYPRAETAREVLPEMLRARGAEVVVAVAYRTVKPEVDRETVSRLLSGGFSAVTFTSSSTVKNFVEIVGPDAIGFLNGVCVACIGPVTKKTCEEMGINVSVVPRDYTVDSLLGALTEHFGRRKV